MAATRQEGPEAPPSAGALVYVRKYPHQPSTGDLHAHHLGTLPARDGNRGLYRAAERQQALIDVEMSAITNMMRFQPGYISASLHRGFDGTTVTSYVPWHDRATFAAMLSKPEAQTYIQQAKAIAESFAVHFCEVVFTDAQAAA
jgi:quinol monooxygenase YgiN